MRKRILACALGVAGALWLVPAAVADTATVGSVAPSADSLISGCTEPCHYAQWTSDPASPSYVVPPVPAGGGAWNVTSWSALGGPGNGAGSVEIWRPTGNQDEFRLIAIGPAQTFPASVVTSHPVNIPVLPGDHLGVLAGYDTQFRPIYLPAPIGDAWMTPHGNPAVGQTMGTTSGDFNPVSSGADGRVNAQAVLTSAPPAAPPIPGKKCKKKKHKRSARSAKKKKCKKKHKH
jgi:hypothetical protein